VQETETDPGEDDAQADDRQGLAPQSPGANPDNDPGAYPDADPSSGPNSSPTEHDPATTGYPKRSRAADDRHAAAAVRRWLGLGHTPHGLDVAR
jgi:hypothetical protein